MIRTVLRRASYTALLAFTLLAGAAFLPGAPGRWALNVWFWIDQGANTIVLLGDPQETISSRLGKWLNSTGIRGAVAEAVCAVLDLVDRGHCETSVNDRVGEKAVIR